MQNALHPADTVWHLEHSYTTLPKAFYSKVFPTPVAAPQLVLFNRPVADALGLPPALEAAYWADVLSGNVMPNGADPIAQAYAGHQFGHFNMLGDGRAILLGEQVLPDGTRRDIQLKGPGPTPYSRRGDGRATLSAMLREYLISEAMHHLGIPTTRSLAVVATGSPVYREQVQKGAVLTRVAASHLRVGTFEYAYHFLELDDLRQLVNYTIDRHYPALKNTERPALELLKAVMDKQIDLMVEWMRVGFIHGVMNTDNMSIAGETIDYGPCAFMNAYRPETVFSSIDTAGRYAFDNQPAIAQWNLAVLASALLPLIHEEEEAAAELAKEVLNSYPEQYRMRWFAMICAKLGIGEPQAGDRALVQQLLQWMELNAADYTNTFLAIADHEDIAQQAPYRTAAFLEWKQQWAARVAQNEGGLSTAKAIMGQVNPLVIPRNHLVENALSAAAQLDDWAPLHQLLDILSRPYTPQAGQNAYQMPPAQGDDGFRTFCGT